VQATVYPLVGWLATSVPVALGEAKKARFLNAKNRAAAEWNQGTAEELGAEIFQVACRLAIQTG